MGVDPREKAAPVLSVPDGVFIDNAGPGGRREASPVVVSDEVRALMMQEYAEGTPESRWTDPDYDDVAKDFSVGGPAGTTNG